MTATTPSARTLPLATPGMRRTTLAALAACAWALALPALAQSTSTLVVSPGGNSGAYLVDGSQSIVRSGTGLCVRTGSWSVELAMRTRIEQSQFSAGCACDEPLMPTGACTAPRVMAPIAAAPAPATPFAPAPPPVATADKVTVPADALFAFDKADLSTTGQGHLDTFLTQIKRLTLEAVVVVGHTDRIGTPAYNATLSEQRAQTVKRYLVGQGVASERVFTEGRGESEPVTADQCAPRKGRGEDRSAAMIACLAPDRRVILEAVGSPTRP